MSSGGEPRMELTIAPNSRRVYDRKRNDRYGSYAMVQKNPTSDSHAMDSLFQDLATALHRVASYKLPGAMDRRLLWLSENKETLSEAEHEELLALIDFSEDRTVEKLQAKILLKRLAEVCPEIVGSGR